MIIFVTVLHFLKILIASSFRNECPIQCPGDGAQGAVDTT